LDHIYPVAKKQKQERDKENILLFFCTNESHCPSQDKLEENVEKKDQSQNKHQGIIGNGG
jgi:hypothetical protein